MNRLILAPLALTAFTLASPARADDGYTACMDKATTNVDFTSCGAAMLARRDAELNRVWKAAYAGLDKSTKAELLTEQRLWNAYKERSCIYWSAGAFGREGQTVHFFTCREGVIDERIAYLKNVGKDG